MKSLSIKTIFLVTALLLLNNCAFKPYRFDLQQGNAISQDKVAQIQPGMSEDQVRFILGTPLLQDVFHTQRWDYIYYLKPFHGEEVQQHLVVYFNEGKVDHISLDELHGSAHA